MCDYSLHAVASRPAKAGERLVSTGFPRTATRGFAAVDNRNVAVCLLPGTELAFEKDIECSRAFFFVRRMGASTARFRQLEMHDAHRDALELPVWIPQSFVTIGLALMAVMLILRFACAALGETAPSEVPLAELADQP